MVYTSHRSYLIRSLILRILNNVRFPLSINLTFNWNRSLTVISVFLFKQCFNFPTNFTQLLSSSLFQYQASTRFARYLCSIKLRAGYSIVLHLGANPVLSYVLCLYNTTDIRFRRRHPDDTVPFGYGWKYNCLSVSCTLTINWTVLNLSFYSIWGLSCHFMLYPYRYNFWIHSVIIKLLPCTILTVISCVLIQVLWKASKRRLKLKQGGNYSKNGASSVTPQSGGGSSGVLPPISNGNR